MRPRLLTTTLTGIDETTDLAAAVELSLRHEHLEWGILLGGHPTARYPSLPFIQSWAQRAQSQGIPVALHLCGRYARAWIENDAQVVGLARQFGRIQVNVVASRIDLDALVDAVVQGRHPAVITQHNTANVDLTRRLAGVPSHAILFDASGGRGQAPDQWPAPVPGKLCGYAGGLGPDTVASELDRIAAAAEEQPFWIDMEGKVRTPDDQLDLVRCSQVLGSVDRWLAAQTPSPAPRGSIAP
jgi:hypothetical protein